MTSTRQVKQELSRLEKPYSCCSSWELKALLTGNGYYTIRRKHHDLVITADHSFVAGRLFNLLRQTGVDAPVVARQQEKRLKRNRFLVQVRGKDQIDNLLVYLDMKEAGSHLYLPLSSKVIPKRDCCRKAFVRGLFLAGGSLSLSGSSGYHLEIKCGNEKNAHQYQRVLEFFKLYPQMRKREDSSYLYFKSAESISDFLRIVGARNVLLQFESMRVVKSVRNQVNRIVNCETANLEKIIATARHQLAIIDGLEKKIGLDNIPSALRQAARARKEFPEASLEELGKKFDPPVGKSGVNHRFRRLEALYNKSVCSVNSKH